MDCQCALDERLGVTIVTLLAIEFGKDAEVAADLGVVGTERILRERKRAFQEWLGLGVA